MYFRKYNYNSILKDSKSNMMRSELDKYFILTGMPRGGTTYLAAVLYNPPDVVTLSEAGGRWKEFYRTYGKSDKIFEIFHEFRTRILRGEKVSTLEGTPGFKGKGRIDTWNQKKVQKKITVHNEFSLGLKNPEVFLAFLEIFSKAGLKCIVTVRHPAFVINSWVKRAKDGLNKGGAIKGKFANGDSVIFCSKLDRPEDRRIDLYNHMSDLIVRQIGVKNILIIRHEDWYVDRSQLDRVSDFLGIPNIGYLRPAPIPADPLIITDQEHDKILKGCMIAAKFGYPAEGNLLKPLQPHETAQSNG